MAVSTDDKKIAQISKKCRAEIPFIRPKELAGDNSSSVDVVTHALAFFEKSGRNFDYILLLEPTSPLRKPEDIDKCIRHLINHERAKSIVSIAKLECTHPEFNVIIDRKSGFIRKLDGSAKFRISRRQDIPDIYFFEGTVYLSEVRYFLAKKTFFHKRTIGYVVPRWKSLEIDDMVDFVCAEALLKAKRKHILT